MEKFFKILLSPMAFAVGFSWPLTTQSLLGLGLVQTDFSGVLVGAIIALAFGVIAQVRGSWIWIR